MLGMPESYEIPKIPKYDLESAMKYNLPPIPTFYKSLKDNYKKVA